MKEVYSILITAGGTREHVDDVRVMTNISTGKLGARIADSFLRNYCDFVNIFYICSSTSALPENHESWETTDECLKIIYANSAQEVFDVMQELVPKMDAVIHSMAVSDFTFDRSIPIKLKSNDIDGFIESMRERIRFNPKIIKHVKEWNPETLLVGFKFEVGLTEDELLNVAKEAMSKNNADFTLANDKEMMKAAKEHVAYWINKTGDVTNIVGKNEIAKYISSVVISTLDKLDHDMEKI
jgi:phosphopantothenate-cysteine ligase